MAQVKPPVGTHFVLHAVAVGAWLAQSGDLPNVISVDPGDEHLPLVIIDEQASNHGGSSVSVAHRSENRLGQAGVGQAKTSEGQPTAPLGLHRSLACFFFPLTQPSSK